MNATSWKAVALVGIAAVCLTAIGVAWMLRPDRPKHVYSAIRMGESGRVVRTDIETGESIGVYPRSTPITESKRFDPVGSE